MESTESLKLMDIRYSMLPIMPPTTSPVAVMSFACLCNHAIQLSRLPLKKRIPTTRLFGAAGAGAFVSSQNFLRRNPRLRISKQVSVNLPAAANVETGAEFIWFAVCH